MEQHAEATLVAARSLTSPLLDALIEDEIHPGTGSSLLDLAVSHFMKDHAGEARYVVVLDRQAVVLAHKRPARLRCGLPHAGRVSPTALTP